MNYRELKQHKDFAEQYENPFVAVHAAVKKARLVKESHDFYIRESQALENVITGKKVTRAHHVAGAITNIVEANLEHVTDEKTRDAVLMSLSKMVTSLLPKQIASQQQDVYSTQFLSNYIMNHDISNVRYEFVYDIFMTEFERARVRILTKLIWNKERMFDDGTEENV